MSIKNINYCNKQIIQYNKDCKPINFKIENNKNFFKKNYNGNYSISSCNSFFNFSPENLNKEFLKSIGLLMALIIKTKQRKL